MDEDGYAIRRQIELFEVTLRAANKAPNTIGCYVCAATMLADWLDATESGRREEVSRDLVEAHTADVIARTSASNAANRFASLQQFFKHVVARAMIDAPRCGA